MFITNINLLNKLNINFSIYYPLSHIYHYIFVNFIYVTPYIVFIYIYCSELLHLLLCSSSSQIYMLFITIPLKIYLLPLYFHFIMNVQMFQNYSPFTMSTSSKHPYYTHLFTCSSSEQLFAANIFPFIFPFERPPMILKLLSRCLVLNLGLVVNKIKPALKNMTGEEGKVLLISSVLPPW